MTEIRWVHGETRARCPLCGDESVKERLVEATAYGGENAQDAIVASRCSLCASTVLEGPLVEDTTPTDLAVDWYVEQFAGIEVILNRLVSFASHPVRRFADVGCNFGFGVDLATRLFGWDSEGFDPSHGAGRGARDLTPRVRQEVLDKDTVRRGEPFDLILASEVIEHVDDPAGFLAGVVSHLQPGGTLVLTTPSSQALRPSTAPAALVAALSPGYHRFLASRPALAALLGAAGLVEIDICDDGLTLVAVAAKGFASMKPLGASGAESHLVKYLDLLSDAPDVSALVRVGAAARHFKQLVLRGRLEAAHESRRRLVQRITERYGFSFDDPAEMARLCDTKDSMPSFVPSVLFADGMLALNTGQPEMADERLDLSVRAWQRLERATGGAIDGESAHLGLMAAGHRLIALAQSDPAGVPEAAERVDRLAVGCSEKERDTLDRVVAASFTGLVSKGEYEIAVRLQGRIDATLESLLGGDPTERRAGLDALFCTAMLALQRGRPAQARALFLRCCEETRGDPSDPHAARLFAESSRHVDGAPDPPGAKEALGGIVHGFDVYWADACGIYIQGFAFVPGSPASAIRVRWGHVVAESAGPLAHSGAAAMYPSDPASRRSGFRADLVGPLTHQLSIEVETERGARRIEVDLPPHPLPDWPTEPDLEMTRRAILDTMARHAPPGPVVALGARGHDDSALQQLRHLFPGRDVLGIDIHEGPGVDLVGDAHVMSSLIDPGSVAVFVSDDVFEHLEVPWLVALQVQRVLRIGGLAAVSVPVIWPEHAAPNDFWRISPHGLRSLFGPQLGFSVVACGGFGAVSVVPGPRMRSRHVSMPVLYAPSSAYVVARKDRDLDVGSVRWPYDPAAGTARAQQYPKDGVETGR